jgi:hypothetical protein
MVRRAGMGGGSMAMGGGGRKPRQPPTMMGTAPGMGMGAMPPRPRPPVGGGPSPMGGAMGPRAAPGAGIGAFKKGGEARKEETRKEETRKEEKEEKREHVTKHAHGGPVIAGHKTSGMPGTMHKAEEGISKGTDGRRGSVRGAGLDPISSQTSNAKARIGGHKKAT